MENIAMENMVMENAVMENMITENMIIESRNCTFRYNGAEEEALRNVSFFLKPGECVLLCGKSGCGKTSFSRLLNGLAPDFFAGELQGECKTLGLGAGAAAIEEYVPLVGSVFQNPKTQYFNVDTEAELAFPCENIGMEPEKIRRRVRECAENFHLKGLLGRSIFKLSGGEKQKLAFAAACMLQPRLLVLDEPTSNLDKNAICELHDMIAQMKARGTAILIAEHRLAWAVDLADRYCLFEEGRLTRQWSAEEMKHLPETVRQEKGLRAADTAACRKQVKKKASFLPDRGEALLTAEGLQIGYGKKEPVRRIEKLQINSSEIVCLMGHNGAGKSTLAKTLCGLVKPVQGKVFWQGRPAAPKKLIQNSFMVMQDVNYQLFSDSVREEVLLGAAHPELCEQVLEALKLSELAERHPMSLSGGQKQRVAIASAMLSGKKLIILDEPTSGLDYYHMTKVAKLLKQLKEQGAAVLVITHDEELAAGWCDRVMYLE